SGKARRTVGRPRIVIVIVIVADLLAVAFILVFSASVRTAVRRLLIAGTTVNRFLVIGIRIIRARTHAARNRNGGLYPADGRGAAIVIGRKGPRRQERGLPVQRGFGRKEVRIELSVDGLIARRLDARQRCAGAAHRPAGSSAAFFRSFIGRRAR